MPCRPPPRRAPDAANYVGARVREERQRLGWTQAALGLAIGRSRSAIAAYETGRKVVSSRVLWAIACVLEIDVGVLFQGGGSSGSKEEPAQQSGSQPSCQGGQLERIP
jgi:transcriptional regulator with XRE-family HTH domain